MPMYVMALHLHLMFEFVLRLFRRCTDNKFNISFKKFLHIYLNLFTDNFKKIYPQSSESLNTVVESATVLILTIEETSS